MSAPTVRRRRLGAKLRALRLERKLTLEETADRCKDFTPSKLSRIETARTAAKAEDIEALLDVYGVDGELRAALLTLTRDGGKRGWWQSYRGVLTPLYEDLISLESEASAVSTYQHGVIPGLLQTAAYAKETLRATAMTDALAERVHALVEVRLARQAVLTSRDEPLHLWAIIHEAVLRMECSNPAIMREQRQKLLSVAELPNVSIQVMPSNVAPHPGAGGAFTILGFPEHTDLDVVYLEHLTNALYVEDLAEVKVYGQAFEWLRAAALSFEDSLAFIAGLDAKT
ncbi:helix-turn-helix transcriptional regulator [Streptomyces sp. B1866]|uniref:helix-turn-helix domain-containing protein n=1 Tax=Streptomyces sp. B1866 TaxID=3075431 RepID=UPI00288EABDB|nr:helix-turn-helix transcriptional regulator [Streptomyces sp. B1866]MDT3395127.1 helix-turn-helix transcriptional regulator [Streptomyces sp. B1866]